MNYFSCGKQFRNVALSLINEISTLYFIAPAVETAVADVPTEMNLDALWDETAPQLSAVLQNPSHIPTDVVPFDAASDLSDDEQKLAF